MAWKRPALIALALGLSAQLLLGPFRQGWSRMETDFPNYYTAAVLTLRHEPLIGHVSGTTEPAAAGRQPVSGAGEGRSGPVPLYHFYDWTWFQRQINYAGIESQLGGYSPFTPLTILPYLPLAKLPPQRAKQVWLLLEAGFLGGTLWLLRKLTGFGLTELVVLALLGHGALSANFQLGQAYIFVLLLLTLSAWCLEHRRDFAGGALLGLIFALKLYTAPFALFFVVRRQWRALAGMLGAVAALALLAVGMFGWDAVWYFSTTVLLRALDGSGHHPYHPGLGSMAVFLRHLLVTEAELNPDPVWNAPAAFFFLRALFSMGVLALALLALPKPSPETDRRALAWFVVVLFVLASGTASYHFVLLLLPVALLLRDASLTGKAALIVLYALLALNLYPLDSWLFPKLWLLLAWFVYSGWPFLSTVRWKPAMAALGALAIVSAADAWIRWSRYQNEPPQIYRRAALEPQMLSSSAPASISAGLVYQAMGEEHYELRISGSGGVRAVSFDGEAFHPAAPLRGEPIYFELVAGGRSRISVLDGLAAKPRTVVENATEPAVSPDGSLLAYLQSGSLFVQAGAARSAVATGEISHPAFFPDARTIAFVQGLPGRRSIRAVAVSGGEVRPLVERGDCFDPAVAPDGTRLAFACSETGARHVWILELNSGVRKKITRGACNNDSPAWDPDSRSLVFASDCSRGLGLPALFRAVIR